MKSVKIVTTVETYKLFYPPETTVSVQLKDGKIWNVIDDKNSTIAVINDLHFVGLIFGNEPEPNAIPETQGQSD